MKLDNGIHRLLVPLFSAQLAASYVFAAPRQPTSDSEVLERLPRTLVPADRTRLREMRAAAVADPLARMRLVRRNFELALAEGDPRYVGRALASLGTTPPAERGLVGEYFLLRAMLRQYRHDFEGAISDLDASIALQPSEPEAYSWRAAIRMVMARYAEVRPDCDRLMDLGGELTAAGCLAYLEGTTGSARSGYARLSRALAERNDASPALRMWIETRLAELALRYGDPIAAERHFRNGIATGVKDNFLLGAYADFLLRANRPGEVLVLLRDGEQSDTLLLRIALAERTLGAPTANEKGHALRERFADSARRGERLHLYEEARFLLELERDATGALRAAKENWRSQREPRDAEIFLATALAAGQREAAGPALAWLRQTGHEDPAMRALAEKLKARP